MLPQAPFGRTGHESTRVIFGAAALGRMRQERADEVLETLLRHGVNHIDTAAGYGDSELRIGPWMAEHRSRFFLATKTGERRGDAARAELERSLERLQVDSVDLIQLHNLVEPDEWDVAHGPGGAVEALVRARDEGLIRFIGVTGHGTRIAAMHLRSLERFAFDRCCCPYSFVGLQDRGLPGRRRGAARRLRRAQQVAVQTIKAVGPAPLAGRLRGSRASAGTSRSRDDAAIGRAVRWVLGHPQLFLNTSSDATLLETILQAAASGGPRPSDDELRRDVEALAVQPLFERPTSGCTLTPRSQGRDVGGGDAAVDQERAGGDEAGLVGGQEQHGVGDLLGLGEPAHRDVHEPARRPAPGPWRTAPAAAGC